VTARRCADARYLPTSTACGPPLRGVPWAPTASSLAGAIRPAVSSGIYSRPQPAPPRRSAPRPTAPYRPRCGRAARPPHPGHRRVGTAGLPPPGCHHQSRVTALDRWSRVSGPGPTGPTHRTRVVPDAGYVAGALAWVFLPDRIADTVPLNVPRGLVSASRWSWPVASTCWSASARSGDGLRSAQDVVARGVRADAHA
jgi:hypothetical protein